MSIIRGDSTLWDITLVDPATLEPYPLQGCTVWVTVKKAETMPDTEALYQHWISFDVDGETVDAFGLSVGSGGAVSGTLVQELTPAESVDFETGDYLYDVQIMMADGRISTPLNGDSETVSPDVTRAISRPEVTP